MLGGGGDDELELDSDTVGSGAEAEGGKEREFRALMLCALPGVCLADVLSASGMRLRPDLAFAARPIPYQRIGAFAGSALGSPPAVPMMRRGLLVQYAVVIEEHALHQFVAFSTSARAPGPPPGEGEGGGGLWSEVTPPLRAAMGWFPERARWFAPVDALMALEGCVGEGPRFPVSGRPEAWNALPRCLRLRIAYTAVAAATRMAIPLRADGSDYIPQRGEGEGERE